MLLLKASSPWGPNNFYLEQPNQAVQLDQVFLVCFLMSVHITTRINTFWTFSLTLHSFTSMIKKKSKYFQSMVCI